MGPGALFKVPGRSLGAHYTELPIILNELSSDVMSFSTTVKSMTFYLKIRTAKYFFQYVFFFTYLFNLIYINFVNSIYFDITYIYV